VDFDTQTFTGSPSRVQTSAKSQITASWSPAFLKSLVLPPGRPGEDTPGGGLTMVLTLPAAPARPAAEPRGTRRIRAA
jgi:hypothetical protein